MSYTKTTWVNDQAPAINATNLNKIENELETLDTGLASKLDTSAVKTSNTTSNSNVYSCTYVNNQLSNKLNTSAVKTSKTTSNTDTYCCTYVNGKFTSVQSISFDNEWLVGTKVYGGGYIYINIPIYNPELKTPTLSFTSAEVYGPNGWETSGIVNAGAFKTFVQLGLNITASSAAVGPYLIRMKGTITIPNN